MSNFEKELISTLESERIHMRLMQKTDVDIVFEFNTSEDNLQYVVRKPFKSKEEALEKLGFFLEGNINQTAFWWVFTHKETKEKIGYGGLFHIDKDHKRAEIGYGILQAHWNKGYMSEIVKEMVHFGLHQLNLHKIYGVILEGNTASVQLLEKIGFKKEAHLKEHSFLRGKYVDETIYSLIHK
jgi:ribosomal-protein-alanine N-acetyltransferase